ncbi:MAG TPA: nuclear transport factor 2 family protein [Stellaceae bacterium]|nr:nuclear transport factor 2 family protein [Stellaceae bacterium]
MDRADILQELRDRQEITDLIHLYCRAVDRCDEALLRSVFHPDSTHEHGPFKGSSSDFCGFAIAAVTPLVSTQHVIGNVVIKLDGDVAQSEAYFIAYHRLPKGRELEGLFRTHDVERDEEVIVGGRYLDRHERREGVWKIAHRLGTLDWQTWHTADDRDFSDFLGGKVSRRDRDDPVYRGVP